MALWGSGVRIPSAPPALHNIIFANSSSALRDGDANGNAATAIVLANFLRRHRAGEQCEFIDGAAPVAVEIIRAGVLQVSPARIIDMHTPIPDFHVTEFDSHLTFDRRGRKKLAIEIMTDGTRRRIINAREVNPFAKPFAREDRGTQSTVPRLIDRAVRSAEIGRSTRLN